MSEAAGTMSIVLSVRSDDPRVVWLAQEATCYLDDVDISNDAHTASTEGWADCFLRGSDGHVLVSGGEIVEERRYGVVRFEFTAEGEAMARQWGWW